MRSIGEISGNFTTLLRLSEFVWAVSALATLRSASVNQRPNASTHDFPGVKSDTHGLVVF